ncbi:MAG: hypothetical protein ACFFFC_11310 [Candidatus Thorarchaeota archaeon]
MFEGKRIQDLIIIILIASGIISAALLAGNASYYSNSVALAEFVEVEVDDITVTNIDPTNYSVNPTISFVLNFNAPDDIEGEAYLVYIRILAHLNEQSIVYATFRRDFSFQQEALHAGYDENHNIGSDILEDKDKDVLYEAYNSVNWTWSLTVRYNYSVMSSTDLYRRTVGFFYEGVTLL